MYTRSQQCAGACIVLPKVVMNATPFVVHRMCMHLHDGVPLLMLVLLRIPFLLVCLANSYSFFNTQLRHLFLCAACLDSFLQGAGLITDSFATPLTSNIYLLHQFSPPQTVPGTKRASGLLCFVVVCLGEHHPLVCEHPNHRECALLISVSSTTSAVPGP